MAYNPRYAKKTEKYRREYAKKTYKRYSVNVRIDDIEMINLLESKKSVSGYLLELIRKDMGRDAE